MCTHITTTAAITGSGKGGSGWFPVEQVSVGYDHATQGTDEHALLLDFVNYNLGLDARLAVELDLGSAKTLLTTLEAVIHRAERAGLE